MYCFLYFFFDFSWKVRLGDFNLASSDDDDHVQEFNIRTIYNHPKYVSGKAYFDIAVLVIPPVVFTSYVTPICLPKPSVFNLDQYEGDSSTLIGFGTSFRSGDLSNMLQRTVVTIYDYRYVMLLLHFYNKI